MLARTLQAVDALKAVDDEYDLGAVLMPWLNHPSFIGLAEDLVSADVVGE